MVLAVGLSSTVLARRKPKAPVRHENRVLVYPPATETGREPPELRLRVDGTPLSLYFPDHLLDPRGEVHFVTTPRELGLRIAERTAFLFATRAARAGHRALLTVTLQDGRPLNFRVLVVPSGEPADATVEVRVPSEGGALPPQCEAPMQALRDQLAECRDTRGDAGLRLISEMLVAAPTEKAAVEWRPVHFRDKQNRIFVEAVDAVRLYDFSWLRIRIENRDPGKAWVLGDVTAAIVGPGPRRSPLKVVYVASHPTLRAEEETLIVLAYRTPQAPSGASLEVRILEKDGVRHVVLEGLTP